MSKNIYPVLIHDGDKELIVMENDEQLLNFLKNNDPTEVGYVELDEEDSKTVGEAFSGAAGTGTADGGSAFGPIPWNKYAEQLGLNPVQ